MLVLALAGERVVGAGLQSSNHRAAAIRDVVAVVDERPGIPHRSQDTWVNGRRCYTPLLSGALTLQLGVSRLLQQRSNGARWRCAGAGPPPPACRPHNALLRRKPKRYHWVIYSP